MFSDFNDLMTNKNMNSDTPPSCPKLEEEEFICEGEVCFIREESGEERELTGQSKKDSPNVLSDVEKQTGETKDLPLKEENKESFLNVSDINEKDFSNTLSDAEKESEKSRDWQEWKEGKENREITGQTKENSPLKSIEDRKEREDREITGQNEQDSPLKSNEPDKFREGQEPREITGQFKKDSLNVLGGVEKQTGENKDLPLKSNDERDEREERGITGQSKKDSSNVLGNAEKKSRDWQESKELQEITGQTNENILRDSKSLEKEKEKNPLRLRKTRKKHQVTSQAREDSPNVISDVEKKSRDWQDWQEGKEPREITGQSKKDSSNVLSDVEKQTGENKDLPLKSIEDREDREEQGITGQNEHDSPLKSNEPDKFREEREITGQFKKDSPNILGDDVEKQTGETKDLPLKSIEDRKDRKERESQGITGQSKKDSLNVLGNAEKKSRDWKESKEPREITGQSKKDSPNVLSGVEEQTGENKDLPLKSIEDREDREITGQSKENFLSSRWNSKSLEKGKESREEQEIQGTQEPQVTVNNIPLGKRVKVVRVKKKVSESEYEKRLYLYMKLQELREKWPDMKIPQYPKDAPYSVMKKTYEQWKQKIKKTKKGSTIQGYISLLFLGLQMFFSKFLQVKFLDGFFEDQMFFVDKYEKLFVAVSNKFKSSLDFSSFFGDDTDDETEDRNQEGLSVEFKLLFCILFYSLIIIVLRLIFGSFGPIGGEIKNKILAAISGKKDNNVLDASFIRGLKKEEKTEEKRAPRIPKFNS